MRAARPTRRALARVWLAALGILAGRGTGFAQGTTRTAPKSAPPAPAGPSISAPRSVMAGSTVTIFTSRMPPGATFVIARPADPPNSAIAKALSPPAVPVLPAPGLVGDFELRVLLQQDGNPVVLLRQPLATTAPSATLAAPDSVEAGATFPARGIGPNGHSDEVVIVEAGAPAEAEGPRFFPAQNVESTLDAPTTPGRYELRYVMHAPLTRRVVLASRPLTVR